MLKNFYFDYSKHISPTASEVSVLMKNSEREGTQTNNSSCTVMVTVFSFQKTLKPITEDSHINICCIYECCLYFNNRDEEYMEVYLLEVYIYLSSFTLVQMIS